MLAYAPPTASQYLPPNPIMSKPAADSTQDASLNPRPRKLIVCVDGTSNQFSEKNTNVVELYSRIKKDSTQLTYYNSGIGTYARPFWWSFEYQKQQLQSKIDLAIAWNFEKVVLAAYRWLADTYQPGDQIFSFGFSRGAYQVRTLAAMIERVGLIYPGNQEQIPFAWAIYSNDDSGSAKFKEAFCREKVDLHFVGVWNTVASVGAFPRKPFPLANDCLHITHFRHALALDELRVKFLPEYMSTRPMQGSCKEVWFAGTHSDIGGGNKANPTLDRGGEPLKWMMEEAQAQGLSVRLHDVKIGYPHAEVTNSMRGFLYLLLEILPISWKEYLSDYQAVFSRRPHLMSPRVVLPQQSIHWTVGASLDKGSKLDPRRQYGPKAIVFNSDKKKVEWKDIDSVNRGFAVSIWADDHQFTRMVNILQAEPDSAKGEWLDMLYDYALGENRGQPEVIWAYGGPQLLHRLFSIYPHDPKTTQIARSIIGFDPKLPWNGLADIRKPELAERLRDMVIPRVGLLLTQWVSESPKSVTEPNCKPSQKDRWTWISRLFGSGSKNTGETDSVDAKWNLDRVPKEDRSIELACAMVDLVSDFAKTKHAQVVQEASAKLAGLIVKLLSDLTIIHDGIVTGGFQPPTMNLLPGSHVIDSVADWDSSKAALAERLLDAVAALFRYDLSKQPFADGGIGFRLEPLICGSQKQPKLSLLAIRTLALLSQDSRCRSSLPTSGLLALIRDRDQIQDVPMKTLLVHEALATALELSKHYWLGLDFAWGNNVNIWFNLLENQEHVDDTLRILQNISRDHPDSFTSNCINILAKLMDQNVDASLTLAHVAGQSSGRFNMGFLEAYSQEGVTNTAVKLLNHPQEAQVLAAAYLLRNLVDREANLKKPSDESRTFMVLTDVSQALTNSLQASPRSQETTEELLATVVRVTLHSSISAEQFALLSSLASAGNKQAVLAISAAAAYNESYQESIGQYIQTLIDMVVPEGERLFKESAEVLAALVRYALSDDYVRKLVSKLVNVARFDSGSFNTLNEPKIMTVPVLKLVEALCVEPLARKLVVEAEVLKAIVVGSKNGVVDYYNGELVNYAKIMLDRLARYEDLKTSIELLREETKEPELQTQNYFRESTEWGADTEETTPLLGKK